MNEVSLLKIVFHHEDGEFGRVLEYMLPTSTNFDVNDLTEGIMLGYYLDCRGMNERIRITLESRNPWVMMTFDENRNLKELLFCRELNKKAMYTPEGAAAYIVLIPEGLLFGKPFARIRSFEKLPFNTRLVAHTDLFKNKGVVDLDKISAPFPYLIIRMMSAQYVKVPVQLDNTGNEVVDSCGVVINMSRIADEDMNEAGTADELLLAKLKRALLILLEQWQLKRGCVVLGERMAWYCESGVFSVSEKIPRGGTVIYQGKETSIPDLGRHW